ncbi:MAG: UDP-N-acetylglucosamine 1-carboxyvinyltransferase [Parcubacteria group bacterium Gr01-1014_107]|nr:MAG: UDP-N-acetylglucosamine 1-carboxyvinyltransferase [Parcubacteria group bacterium Gr01-1014_107]
MNKDRFVIEGLAGQKKLSGSIAVRGSKNAVLPVMASSLLFKDNLTLKGIPSIEDVFQMANLLRGLGMKVRLKDGRVRIDPNGIEKPDLDEEIAKRMRASIFLVGPLLAREGIVSFPHPGGCVIGERPIDLFVDGFRKMGAKLKEKGGRYWLKSVGKLRGAEIFFPAQSVGATETLMMAAVLAEGKTILKNVALEPEVESLGEFLISSGARIKGLGTTTIEIRGGGLLKSKRAYKTIPDRLETGCFLILSALAGRNVLIKNCEPKHVEILLETLKRAGVKMKIGKDSVRVLQNKKLKHYQSVNIKTHEYPGFPTDLQAPMVVFLTQAKGEAVVFETIFESRLNYTQDLVKMGADITLWDAHRVMVKGPTSLRGRELEGPDIRAGLAFTIAAAVAKGHSIINNVYYIDRGYERIETRLRKIGVDIKRTNN